MREHRNPGRYLVAAKAGSVLSSFEGTQVASDCSLKTTQKKVRNAMKSPWQPCESMGMVFTSILGFKKRKKPKANEAFGT